MHRKSAASHLPISLTLLTLTFDVRHQVRCAFNFEMTLTSSFTVSIKLTSRLPFLTGANHLLRGEREEPLQYLPRSSYLQTPPWPLLPTVTWITPLL